jgi:serine/tyrosine/threonine adenylyltransferase
MPLNFTSVTSIYFKNSQLAPHIASTMCLFYCSYLMPDTTQQLANWQLEHSYQTLPQRFFSKVLPTPVAQPRMVVFNSALAERLGWHMDAFDADTVAAIHAGNLVLEGSQPIAQAYAGHQFGHFTMLGDGRTILLGEQVAPDGARFDIQLKGSGPTPYSRRGDGRATLSAMLREYLVSEAMNALGIPTTRSLAVVATGEPVYREQLRPGAVLTRVAESHIRVGTFEFARQFLDTTGMEQLLHYTLERHYPELRLAENPALALLRQVMHRQINLVVDWMRVGFIHGVMNTDNMSIAGETIDYGPCAFMNAYDPETVFSSIDTQGRYAFGNQAAVAQWNLAVLGSALLPLLHIEQEKAVAMVQDLISGFPEQYRARWFVMMCRKLGLAQPQPADVDLVQSLLQWMELHGADYTQTYLAVSGEFSPEDDLFQSAAFETWRAQWLTRVAQNSNGLDTAQALMRQYNPVYIPRNHQVERALQVAEQGDMAPFQTLLNVLQHPYAYRASDQVYTQPPLGGDEGYQTFCGT